MNILGSSELCDDVQKKDLCVDCGACVGLCPYFVSHKGKIARLFVCTLPQGRCHAHCPKSEINLDAVTKSRFGSRYDGSPLGHVRSVWKARAGDRLKGSKNFQNGGTVSALLAAALDMGLIKAAALTDRTGLTPKPVLASDLDSILASSGSKYVASPTLETVNTYSKHQGEKLAVVGTPCQMTALARMRMNPLNRDDFHDSVALSIGLFCSWALDKRRLKALLSETISTDDIISMDVPPPPAQVMILKTLDKTIEVPLSDIRTTIPAGCSICPDMTSELSDMSVGVLEADPSFNTLIIRTQTGESLADYAVKKGYLIWEELGSDAILPLKKAAHAKKQKALNRAGDMSLLNTDPEKGRSALIIDPDIIHTILTGDAK